MAEILIKRVHEDAKMPVKGSPGAAGFDLTSVEEIVIPPHGKALISTGLTMAFMGPIYGRIASRSGLALKNHIDIGGGVIDADYRGVVKVILFNHGSEAFMVNSGDRIAQLIPEMIASPKIVEVDDLGETKRGAGGFGSSGVKSEPIQLPAELDQSLRDYLAKKRPKKSAKEEGDEEREDEERSDEEEGEGEEEIWNSYGNRQALMADL
jgi:dUTP pyrophosphatase